MLVRIFVFILTRFVWLLVALLEGLARSPAVHRLADLVVTAAAYFLTRLLAVEAVQTAVSATLAEGFNAFLRQPNLEEHLLQMADTMSKTQPELARQQGRDFPVIVGNFLQGMLTPNKGKVVAEDKDNNSKKDSPSKNDKENVASRRASSPASMLRTLSFPMLLQKSHSGMSLSADAGDDVGLAAATSSPTTTTNTATTTANSTTANDNYASNNGSVMDESSFHYRYGPTGIHSNGETGATAVEQQHDDDPSSLAAAAATTDPDPKKDR